VSDQAVRGFVSLGHTRAVYVPPPVGGLFLDQEAVDAITGGPFLIDHDQRLAVQGALFWDIGQSGAWLGANVRYDSGLITDAAPGDLLADPANAFAAPYVVIHSGTELDPNRIKPGTIASFSFGVDLATSRPPLRPSESPKSPSTQPVAGHVAHHVRSRRGVPRMNVGAARARRLK
jgi:hypothetical protein